VCGRSKPPLGCRGAGWLSFGAVLLQQVGDEGVDVLESRLPATSDGAVGEAGSLGVDSQVAIA